MAQGVVVLGIFLAECRPEAGDEVNDEGLVRV